MQVADRAYKEAADTTATNAAILPQDHLTSLKSITDIEQLAPVKSRLNNLDSQLCKENVLTRKVPVQKTWTVEEPKRRRKKNSGRALGAQEEADAQSVLVRASRRKRQATSTSLLSSPHQFSDDGGRESTARRKVILGS
ncbi:hypothetical protein H6P81_001143 [Aristolochia fimbriata]|uniref:Uncharacterized protein n=1 Tax=Aristolochia fimbriata TaxID=158543 RepID=A0AAV7F625_ARIFI|nr:hypothetical protein H6P81_001143 [Aristolochia fimbriata]